MMFMVIRRKLYYTYIVSGISKVLYVGFTDCLVKRIYQHKREIFNNAFSKKYKTNRLVYYGVFNTCNEAFQRERQIKKWRREKKFKIII